MATFITEFVRVRKMLRTLARRVVPLRWRPLLRTAWSALLALLLTFYGFLKGRQFATSDAVASLADSHQIDTKTDVENPLETYFFSHTEGRGIWKWTHYFDIYHRHFSKFIGREVRILEVGVYSGGSLAMWKEYFGAECVVYGVDIEEACKVYEDDSTHIHIGDQADRDFWRRFKETTAPVDIIVDDGGHETHQQIVTLEEMFGHLRPGGVYLCEDVVGRFNGFHSYVNGLALHLNDKGPGSPSQANSFQRSVSSVHLYPYVVIMEKADKPVTGFISAKRGTEWQPWLSQTLDSPEP